MYVGLADRRKPIVIKGSGLKKVFKETEYRQSQIKVKEKSHKKIENIQRIWIMYIIMFSLNFLTVKELSTERHFIVQTAKLNQQLF